VSRHNVIGGAPTRKVGGGAKMKSAAAAAAFGCAYELVLIVDLLL